MFLEEKNGGLFFGGGEPEGLAVSPCGGVFES